MTVSGEGVWDDEDDEDEDDENDELGAGEDVAAGGVLVGDDQLVCEVA